MSTLLPVPDGPRMTVIIPSGIPTSRPLSTRFLPKDLWTSMHSTDQKSPGARSRTRIAPEWCSYSAALSSRSRWCSSKALEPGSGSASAACSASWPAAMRGRIGTTRRNFRTGPEARTRPFAMAMGSRKSSDQSCSRSKLAMRSWTSASSVPSWTSIGLRSRRRVMPSSGASASVKAIAVSARLRRRLSSASTAARSMVSANSSSTSAERAWARESSGRSASQAPRARRSSRKARAASPLAGRFRTSSLACGCQPSPRRSCSAARRSTIEPM